jgi:hypothetical protein
MGGQTVPGTEALTRIDLMHFNHRYGCPRDSGKAAMLSPAVRRAASPQLKLRSAAVLLCAGLLSSTAAFAAGPTPVNLGRAGFFTILSQAGIQDVPGSAIVGNVGTSPITGAADHLSCSEVTGRVFSVDAAGPAPCSVAKAAVLTVAVGAMTSAYNDAAGRRPDVSELGAGNIGGLTIAPGTYSWSSGVMIPGNVTLHGKAKDVWIFQVAQDVDVASGAAVVLTGGAKAKNVFWQVAGQVTMGTTSHFEGTVLSATQIAMKTGASINGRLFAQTAVTLEMNAITRPHG